MKIIKISIFRIINLEWFIKEWKVWADVMIFRKNFSILEISYVSYQQIEIDRKHRAMNIHSYFIDCSVIEIEFIKFRNYHINDWTNDEQNHQLKITYHNVILHSLIETNCLITFKCTIACSIKETKKLLYFSRSVFDKTYIAIKKHISISVIKKSFFR